MSDEDLFHLALEKGPGERSAFLDRACAGDVARRHRMDALLRSHETPDSFLAGPPVGPGAVADLGQDLTADVGFGRPDAEITDRRTSPEGPGSRIGPYKLLQQLGEGGMGVVYMAEQTQPVRRKVALKIIKPGMDTKQVIARFEAERQALALMDHPNIAKVLDAGATDSGRPYFVMDLVRGIPITDYCDKACLSVPERLELFVLVCRAVQHAHQKGIIHRDLKPSNVMVTLVDGAAVPRVIDFGVAKATGGHLTDRTLFTGFAQLVGTPLYMSPEQAALSGVDVDTRSDIYALGVLLYELLTGTTPIDRGTFCKAAYDEIRRVIREQETPTPSTRLGTFGATLSAVSANRHCNSRELSHAVRGELDWIVMKALEKDRARRYETASDFAADVMRHLTDQPVEACPPSAGYRLRKLARRNRVALTTAGLIALALIVGTAVSTWQAIRVTKAERRVSAALALSRAQTVTAEALRRQAQDAAEQGRRRQVQLNVEQGTRLMNDGDLAGSLPSFVEALRLDADDTARVADHRLRLGMLLARCAKPSRIWFQEEPLSAVLLRPDGRAVAIGLRDGTVVVRDVATGEPVGPTWRHPNVVESLEFSPDGLRLAVACVDGTARVWDVATGRDAFPPLKHPDRVEFLAFSPDGRLLYTSGPGTRSSRVWDAATGGPVTDWLGGGPFFGRFSPDGHLLAFCGPNALHIVDARTGLPSTPPIHHEHGVNLSRTYCFSPDGRRVVTGCLDSTVRIWDTTTGKPTVPAMRHAHWTGATFSPDGRRVLSRSIDGTARVWDAATGTPRCDPMRHPAAVTDALFSPDGTRVATRCDDHAVRVWDAATGRLLLPPLWHLAPLSVIEFSPDGRTVLTADAGQTVRLWDLAGASPAGPRLVDLGRIYEAHFTADGRLLVTKGMGGVARVWDSRTGAPSGPPLVAPADWLPAGEISPDGRSFAALGGSGQREADAWIWDLATRRVTAGPLAHRLGADAGNAPTRFLAWSPESKHVATAASPHVWNSTVTSVVRVWDARSGQPVTPVLPYDAAIFGLEFSPDGRWLLAAGGLYSEPDRPGEARVLDAATGAPRFPPITVSGVCQAARFSRDGRRLITAAHGTSWGGEARVWDAATGRPLSAPMRHDAPVKDAFFSPDGRLAVTVSVALRVWDAATGTPVLPPIRSPLPFGYVSFSPDGRRLLASCGSREALYSTVPGYVQVFDVATGWPLTPPLWRERFVQHARFSPDGRRFVTTSWVGGALLWDLKPEERPLDDLIRMASILSGTRIDASGAAVPVSMSELREAYEVLLRKDTREFTASREQLLGWEHQQALGCETAGEWDAAVKHLDRLIEDGPRVEALVTRRGLAHAELGQWKEASRDLDLDIRKLTPQAPFHVWYQSALFHLGSGDLAGYRAACAGMLHHFGGADAAGETARFTAWTCCLAPDAFGDFAPVLALAERVRAGQPESLMASTALGALLYRAGRFAEAVDRLTEVERLPPDERSSPIYTWYFLAMAHHRAGHVDEARRWLAQATAASDKAIADHDHDRGAEPLPLQRRLTLSLLSTEAKGLLGVKAPPGEVAKEPASRAASPPR